MEWRLPQVSAGKHGAVLFITIANGYQENETR
jgi:hypothetical protein